MCNTFPSSYPNGKGDPRVFYSFYFRLIPHVVPSTVSSHEFLTREVTLPVSTVFFFTVLVEENLKT